MAHFPRAFLCSCASFEHESPEEPARASAAVSLLAVRACVRACGAPRLPVIDPDLEARCGLPSSPDY